MYLFRFLFADPSDLQINPSVCHLLSRFFDGTVRSHDILLIFQRSVHVLHHSTQHISTY
jgi:hypothetical protein